MSKQPCLTLWFAGKQFQIYGLPCEVKIAATNVVKLDQSHIVFIDNKGRIRSSRVCREQHTNYNKDYLLALSKLGLLNKEETKKFIAEKERREALHERAYNARYAINSLKDAQFTLPKALAAKLAKLANADKQKEH